MVKEAFENNVLHHGIPLQGKQEQISLFFISDVHLRKIDEKMIDTVEQPIHAVIIGGDLADKRTPFSRIEENIKLLKTLGPVYFVWGNNDREVGEGNLRELFHKLNVTIIENDAILIPQTQNECWISAIADATSQNADYENAFLKCKGAKNVVFVSHNPEVFRMVRRNYKTDLMMGGHLHGGQIRLGPFGMHPHGSFSIREGVPTLISNGYGTTAFPLRFGAKPQCHIITLNFEGQ
ncbi:serine/threonine protein phosphatase [Lysinibacillus yapensis]|uniref:Serine/threonine protein phosphatase n=2 Tax=Ureibacillus yapensis TaxID=2304605 RepID=A0A396SET5_9BACL|nr:serine/threonine protein phosphatase [Lysinibacillus yapensis]